MTENVNNTERDKFLTEAMEEYWHETSFMEYELTIDGCTGEFIKKKCSCGRIASMGKAYSDKDSAPLCQNMPFNTWEGFGKLLTWCASGNIRRFDRRQEWWGDFVAAQQPRFISATYGESGGYHSLPMYLINPDSFATAVYTFLKRKEQNK